MSDTVSKPATGTDQPTASSPSPSSGLTSEELAKFPEANPNLVLRLDSQGTITYMNPACLSFLEQLGLPPSAGNQLLPANIVPHIAVVLAGDIERFEFEHVVGGRTIHYSMSAFPGDRHSFVTGLDITGRKNTEQALLDSENQYRTLFETSTDALLLHDDNRQNVDVNARACQLYGFSREEMLQLRSGTLLSGPDCDEALAAEYNRRALAGETLQFEWTGRRKDGSTFPEEVTLNTIRISGRDHVLATVRDITRRKKAEQALRESEERYHSLINNVPIGVFRTTPAGRILDANPALVHMLGYDSVENLQERNIEQEGYAEGCSRSDFCRQIEAAGQIRGLEAAWRRKDGSVIYVSENAKAVRDEHGQTVYYEGTVEDITGRKKTEMALRSIAEGTSAVKEEDIFRSLARNLSSVLEVRYVLISECVQHENQRLRPVACWDGTKFRDMPEYEVRDTPCEQVLRGSPVHHPQGLVELFPRDLELKALGAVSYLGLPLRAHAGTIIGVMCVIDVKPIGAELANNSILHIFATRAAAELQRKKSAEALEQAERKYRGIFENAIEGIYQSTMDGRYITVNPMMVEILGYESADDMLAATTHLASQCYVDARRRREFVERLKSDGSVAGFESRVKRKDGSLIWISENAHLLWDHRGRPFGFEGTVVEITQRKQTEGELRHRVEFEKLITSISTQFINLNLERIDHEIASALKHIGSFVGVDRSYIFLYSRGCTVMSNTHEWCAAGIKPQQGKLQNLSVETFPIFHDTMRRRRPFHMPRITDLPPEAVAEKKEFESESIKSLLCVPMVYSGSLVGFLGFDSVRREKVWSNDTIALLKIVGEIFVNALERKRSEEQLHERIEFEKLITHLSTEFINLPTQHVDSGITNALKTVGEFVRADRSYVIQLSDDQTLLSTTHEWCADSIEPQMDSFQNVPVDLFPWARELIRVRQSLHIPRVCELPAEADGERQLFEREGTLSLVCVPMFSGDKPVGIVGFDAMRREQQWSDDTLALLKILGEIFVNVIQRSRFEHALRLTQFSVDRAADPEFWIAPDARLQYVNEAACQALGYTAEQLRSMSVPDIDPEVSWEVWTETWQTVKQQGKLFLESVHRTSQGHCFPVEITANFLEFQGREYVCASARNITERKRAEQALRDSERRFRTLAENIPGVVYLCKNDARYTMQYLNDAVEELTGYPKERFLEDGVSFVELYHPEDAPQISEAVDNALTRREPFHLVYRLKHRDGQYRWIEEIGVGVFVDDQLSYLEGFLSDITHRKEAEQALKESQRALATLMSNLPGMAYRCRNDRRWTMEFASEGCLELTGYEPADLIGNSTISFAELIHPLDREQVWDQIQTALAEHRPFLLLYRILTRDQELKWVWEQGRGISSASGELLALEGFITDTTERKRAEEALRESETRYRTLFEGSSNAIFLYDAEGRILDVNEIACQMYGYTRQEMLDFRVGGLLSGEEPSSRERVNELIERARAGETLFFEWTGRRRDGSMFPEEVALKPVTIGGRRYLLGIVRDFTERKQAEEALRAQRKFLRQIIDLNPDFIFAKDREGRFTLVNKAIAEAYGTTVEDLIGKTDADYNPNQSEVEHFRRADLKVMDTQEELFIPEEVITDSDGKLRYLQTVKRPIIDASGKANQVLGVATDITERKRAEEDKQRLQAQLFQAQKMESIGLLAGGIAHDFNNLLAGILGFSSMAAEELGPLHPARKSLDLITQAAEKAAKLTRELLAYARGGPQLREVFDLNRLISDLLNLLRVNLPKHVKIDQHLCTQPMVIHADPAQIQQVIMNLCLNAGEAIGQAPGRITITTRKARLTPQQCLHAPEEGADFVVLEVCDTGCGMSDEVKNKIFDPFFSTKRFGRGMGLAAVQGIVDNHKGAIDVESEPGQGTTFVLKLPVSDQATPAPTATGKATSQGTETILVADDEAVVRSVAHASLTKLGYRVMTARSGHEALAAYQRQPEAIDLVLLDLMMPDMNGERVLEELRRHNRNVRVLISSGYSERMALERVDESTVLGFIQKPYTAQVLGAAVRKALDEVQTDS